MAKKMTAFFCSNCGYESAKWMGQCPGCKEWNTMVEEPTEGKNKGIKKASGTASKPVLLKDIQADTEERFTTGSKEFDRVLGGGIVRGSLVLIGGDPGIGKSTLLLQVTRNLSVAGKKVLYVSGEESQRQIKMRADRLGSDYKEMKLLCETDLDVISGFVTEEKPDMVVIDSIQTMYREDISSAPGSVSQVREATSLLLSLAKSNEISIFIVGHVTKEGAVAGPRVLEHMVDSVLYFEGDTHGSYRILRGVKNRFGSTNEIGVFEMREEGLAEVPNPSEFMLSGRAEDVGGSVVTCTVEGTRPLMLEIQALVCKSSFGIPRRQATGLDYNRVNLLMAVIEKRGGLQIGDMDAYVNIAGGIKINEPSVDLATVMSIISAFKNKPIDPKTVIFGEVGLNGEVRAVGQAEARVREAAKLGFTCCIMPKANINETLKKIKGIELIGVSNINEAKNFK
ncbi:MAG: DNA repair protein RadA [Lachnospiraceae bacterium]|nr:DNA repair protein RadA [Lachnospiraceae bacterium]